MSGIFGVIGGQNCSEELFYGTDYHSHLGTEFAGIALMNGGFYRRIHSISQDQFKAKFYSEYKNISGDRGIGAISSVDEQPIYLNSKFGPLCIVMNGLIENSKELAERLLEQGISFSEVGKNGVNIIELVAKLINQGKTIPEGIEKMFKLIEGSCSLMIVNHDGIYVARDRYGYTPLVIGKGKNAWAVTSETTAFYNTGFDVFKYVSPGEIILLDKSGPKQILKGADKYQVCAFLWIYSGFPASSYEGISAESAREKCGRTLARRDKDLKADLVSGIPDSGIAHAIGYAMESKIPYRRPLVKYTPGYGRSYTPPSQKTRDLVAKMKLIPIKDIIQNNRIVVCEDSIVRGTQLKNFTVKKLWDFKAKEIHVRPACPPIMFPCRFNLSTKGIKELAARKAIKAIEGYDLKDVSEYVDCKTEKYKKMVEWIRKDIEVTTLKYQTIDDMVEAIGLPKEKLCLYCWLGKRPENNNCQGASNCSGKKLKSLISTT